MPSMVTRCGLGKVGARWNGRGTVESDMRVLSFELGRAYGLRINTISAGALKSRAASAIGGAKGEKTCAEALRVHP